MATTTDDTTTGSTSDTPYNQGVEGDVKAKQVVDTTTMDEANGYDDASTASGSGSSGSSNSAATNRAGSGLSGGTGNTGDTAASTDNP